MNRNELDFELIKEWTSRIRTASDEANKILSTCESSLSRVITLDKLVESISSLPIDVRDYFSEAKSCLEFNLLRASVVLSWSGFFHVFIEKMYSLHEHDIRKERPKWSFTNLHELKERIPEFQLLELAKKINFINSSDLHVYKGQLAKRNKCAHPTFYQPSLNEALGFMDEILQQTIKALNKK